MRCYGSIQRSAGMPSLPNDYSVDGTEAHELLEFALLHGYKSAYLAKPASKLIWTHRKDNEEVRIQSVQDGLDHVNDLLEAYASPNTTVYLETQFTFPTYENDDCGGTSDVTIFVPELDIMVVADFKHGAGIAVDAVENSQAMTYAVGSRQELRRRGLCNSGKTLYRIMIMQPRAWHREGAMREWTCDDARLDAFIGEVNFAIAKTKEPIPEIVPGRWCRYCPAVAACPEAEEHKMRSIIPTYKDPNTLRQTGLPNVAELSAERIAEILSMRDMVVEWLNAVEAQAMALARKGGVIPGKKLVLAQAKSKWAANTEADMRVTAGHLASLTGLPPEVFLRPKLVTITEARTAIKQGIYDLAGKKNSKKLMEQANEALAQLLVKDTSGNIVMVDRDDKRPEVNLANLIQYTPIGDNNEQQVGID
jgi:hypothetical protein